VETLKIGLCLAAISACAVPSVSFAQDDSVRLNAGATLAVAGKVSTEIDGSGAADVPDFKLAPTYGFYAGVEVPVHTYFTIGGEFGLASWIDKDSKKDDADRQLQLDFLARPKLRFEPIDKLEVYGVVPVGLTYYVPSDDMSGAGVDVKGGPGVAVGVSAGATYFVTERVGLNAEMGYLYHRAKMSAEEGGHSTDAHLSFGQLQLRAGVSFAF
jgi:hypothetical protein